ncbi:hypothetical protein SAMN05519103_09676 [Rhizobiales bacterium GAS113]|nr:hypothetical protein SAMN05519103_09676 [Rhizobiales bacterium GAS113]
MNTNMSRSEKIVACVAIAVLVAGFSTGIFHRSPNTSVHRSLLSAHPVTTQAQQNDRPTSRREHFPQRHPRAT